MPLAAIYVVPHSPILLPSLRDDHQAKLQATINAYEKLANQLSGLNLDTLVIISNHDEKINDAFSIQTRPSLVGDLKVFGDFATNVEVKVDLAFINQWQKILREEFPIALISDERLDHGVTVPIILLTKPGTRPKIIHLNSPGLPPAEMWSFGRSLGQILRRSTRRIGLVISGDLSHALLKNSPAGYHPDGEKFDQLIMEVLDKQEFSKLLTLEAEFVNNAAQCIYEPLVVLGGILEGHPGAARILSYEAPLGVGMLVAEI